MNENTPEYSRHSQPPIPKSAEPGMIQMMRNRERCYRCDKCYRGQGKDRGRLFCSITTNNCLYIDDCKYKDLPYNMNIDGVVTKDDLYRLFANLQSKHLLTGEQVSILCDKVVKMPNALPTASTTANYEDADSTRERLYDELYKDKPLSEHFEEM